MAVLVGGGGPLQAALLVRVFITASAAAPVHHSVDGQRRLCLVVSTATSEPGPEHHSHRPASSVQQPTAVPAFKVPEHRQRRASVFRRSAATVAALPDSGEEDANGEWRSQNWVLILLILSLIGFDSLVVSLGLTNY